jgi:hypothetical protein
MLTTRCMMSDSIRGHLLLPNPSTRGSAEGHAHVAACRTSAPSSASRFSLVQQVCALAMLGSRFNHGKLLGKLCETVENNRLQCWVSHAQVFCTLCPGPVMASTWHQATVQVGGCCVMAGMVSAAAIEASKSLQPCRTYSPGSPYAVNCSSVPPTLSARH